MRGLLAGARTVPRALALLRAQPRLRRYVVVPVAVTLAVGAALYALLLVVGSAAIDRLVGTPTGLAALLGGLLRFLLVVLLLLAVAFLAVRFGVVLGSPWYARLSEEVERLQGGSLPPDEPGAEGLDRARESAAEVARALGYEARKLVLVAAVGLTVFLLGLVPLIGQLVGAGLGLMLGGTVACLDFFEGPLERRRASFRAKLRYVRGTLPASAGFAAAALPLLAVPLLNLLSIPVLVAAGTLFWCDRPALDGARRRPPPAPTGGSRSPARG